MPEPLHLSLWILLSNKRTQRTISDLNFRHSIPTFVASFNAMYVTHLFGISKNIETTVTRIRNISQRAQRAQISHTYWTQDSVYQVA